VRNSFALVRVPGVDGVRAYASHQEIGRTNRRGNLLIPDLLPYYGNELNIADTDIPIDYTVPDVRITLAPPYRGGAVVPSGAGASDRLRSDSSGRARRRARSSSSYCKEVHRRR
jgi:outer membrane usher protein FimD/PapC